MRHVLFALFLVCAVASAKGKEKKADPLKATITSLKTAIAKGNLNDTKSALARAEGIRENYKDQKLAPLVAAITKGCAHKDIKLAEACVGTLGRLKIVGSAKGLGKLLSPPAKLADERLALHVAAIEAAASIHDPATQKTLQKLLVHSNVDIAVAAAGAVGGYESLDPKQRIAFAKKLVQILGSLEKKREQGKKEDKKSHARRVAGALNEGLAKLTKRDGISTAADWSKWLKEQAKA